MLEETKNIIAEELNVKNISITLNDSELVKISAKANFKILGPRIGQKMKEVSAKIAKFQPEAIRPIENGESIEIIMDDGQKLQLSSNDIQIIKEEKEGLSAASEAGITIAMDIMIDDDLKIEGIAREIVSKIQNMRKENKLNVSDRIKIGYNTLSVDVREAFIRFSKYISDETLASSLVEENTSDDKIQVNMDEISFFISIKKI
jgi:isoleucyl-tRNA synthetase